MIYVVFSGQVYFSPPSNLLSYYYFLLNIANNITIKRNSKLCVQATKLQAERDKLFSDNQDKILSILHDLQGTMLRVASKLDMEKKVDIEAFFPIKNDSDMLRFLDKTDGQFKFRREEFENMLYCYVTKSIKLKRPFEATLLSTLFSRDYISSHRWPGAR